MKKTYRYNGTQVLRFSVKGENYSCQPGKNYDLNSEDSYIKTLIATGKMEEVVIKTTPKQVQKPAEKVAEPKIESTTLEK